MGTAFAQGKSKTRRLLCLVSASSAAATCPVSPDDLRPLTSSQPALAFASLCTARHTRTGKEGRGRAHPAAPRTPALGGFAPNPTPVEKPDRCVRSRVARQGGAHAHRRSPSRGQDFLGGECPTVDCAQKATRRPSGPGVQLRVRQPDRGNLA